MEKVLYKGDCMRRSKINMLIDEAVQFCRAQNFHLPRFAFWTPDTWETKGTECDEIRRNMLGWDITDFGQGDFCDVGLVIFTLRNGRFADDTGSKTYAEKILIVEENQVTPMHFHWSKVEDIIVRAGGNLLVQVYNATADEMLSRTTPVEVSMDGVRRTVPAGETLRLAPGDSITITTRLYHKFWGEHGKGKVLLGEVSKVNDDTSDNRFLEPASRFPDIDEDESARYLLCNEYPPAPR